ncbi:hypothetical protein ZWY2020_053606 [Hordeum vulgare]|nr:hypothetical protein ZWY2020_053606 [Hordeum vulgare]
MTPPSPSLFLLDPFVGTYLPGGTTTDSKRTLLSYGAKKAFGLPVDLDCDALMRGLALEADLAPAPGLSRLTLRGVRPFSPCVHAVDKNLIIMITSFPKVYPPDICLMYNAIDRSLLMIPFAPRTFPSVLTPLVLVARPRVDDNISYALVFPGTVDGTGYPGRRSVLFVSGSSSKSRWETAKFTHFPDHLLAEKSSFVAKEVFSHRGRGYWVDLLLGGMYCDCSDVFSGQPYMDVHSLDLPVGCERYLGYRDHIPQPRACRAVACVGDYIKFVSITGILERVDLVDDRMVTIWKLKEDMRKCSSGNTSQIPGAQPSIVGVQPSVVVDFTVPANWV